LRRVLHSVAAFVLVATLLTTVDQATMPPVARAVAATASGGLMAYGSSASATPYVRTYDNQADSFSARGSAATAAYVASFQFVVKTSPWRRQAIVGYMNGTGGLQIMCFDGTTWSNEFTATTHGSLSTSRRYDIAYESMSGDVMVMYSTGATATTMAYRTKPGNTGCGSGNWSSENAFSPVRTNSTITWVKMSADRRTTSDRMTVAWGDQGSNLSAMQWNGTSWEAEPSSALTTTLEYLTTGAAGDTQSFDVEYESLSGDVMVAYGIQAGNNGTNGVRYATCANSAAPCTWTLNQTPPTFLDDATVVDLSANPLSDEIVFASIGELGPDLQIGYWSGTTWTNTANADSPAGFVSGNSFFTVATGWLVNGGTARSVVTYRDGTDGPVSWFSGNGAAFTMESDFAGAGIAAAAATQRNMAIAMDPNGTDHLMWTAIDGNRDVWSKRLSMTNAGVFSWSDSDGGAALEADVRNSDKLGGVAFAYWRSPALYDTVEVAVTIDPAMTFTVGAHAAACNGVSMSAGSSSTGTTVDLGRPSTVTNGVGAQDLTVVTNAGSGYLVYLRSTGSLMKAGGAIIADVGSSNASPGAFPSPGTAGFGYTTNDATLSTAAVDRFTNPAARWAAVTGSDAEVVYEPAGVLSSTNCVAYQVGIAATTAAGVYSTTIVYNAVPTF
jgi:hypothetical protein